MNRRAFLRLAGWGGVGLLAARVAPAANTAKPIDPAKVALMEFEVSYRTLVKSLPGDAADIHIWMPLPPSGEGQEIGALSVNSAVPYEVATCEPYGNRIAHVRAARLPAGYSLEAKYRVLRKRVGAMPAALQAAAREKYLRYTSRMRVTDEVAAFAREAIGSATDTMEVARRVYDGVTELLLYDREIPGCGMGDTAWIMRHRRGKCDDYHALFMAALISRGIPVRWEQGFPLPYPSDAGAAAGELSGDCSGAHCWVSFFDARHGWVPIDVSEADKRPELKDFFFGQLTPNRFKVSEGRSIVLNPKQGGDPLETFAYAYAEADGIPLIYPENYENIVRFTVSRVEVS